MYTIPNETILLKQIESIFLFMVILMNDKFLKYINKLYKYLKYSNIVTIPVIFVVFLIYMFLKEITINSYKTYEIFGIAIIGICCLFIFLELSLKRQLKDVQNLEKEAEDYYNIAKKAIVKDTETEDNNANISNDVETTDIIELMLLNMKEIKEYYILSKNMAKRSFILAVIMCILGFIVISSSIVAIFVVDISFMELLVPVIGGSIVEVIAGTSLNVYKKSLEQLNQYYESLHNNERFLSLVNLVDKLTDDKKNDTYINIINSQLEVLKKFQ